jgi:hypothetical protein
MSRILILQNPKGLKALLRKLPASPSGGHKFLNLGDMRQGHRELLKQYGLQEISVFRPPSVRGVAPAGSWWSSKGFSEPIAWSITPSEN